MPEPEKIAVIDDDRSTLRALVRLLATNGREVFPFSSAKEFVTFAETQTVLCVISDLWMPEISGLEVMLATREDDMRNRQTKVGKEYDAPDEERLA